MSDLRRLLDEPDGLSPEERRVLEAGLRARPPKSAKGIVLEGLFARLPPPDVGGLPGGLDAAGAAGTGAVSATKGVALTGAVAGVALAKPAALGFALGVVTAIAGVSLVPILDTGGGTTPNVTSTPPSTPALPVGPVVAPTSDREARPTPSMGDPGKATPARSSTGEPVPIPVDADPTSTTAGITQPPEAPSTRAFPELDSALAAASAESRRLADARALLRGNEPRAALDALERVRADFPRGVLVQEREALTIEAMLASGDLVAAKARSRDFLWRYPTSPHAAAARRVLELP